MLLGQLAERFAAVWVPGAHTDLRWLIEDLRRKDIITTAEADYLRTLLNAKYTSQHGNK